jgi:hypothetical protein
MEFILIAVALVFLGIIIAAIAKFKATQNKMSSRRVVYRNYLFQAGFIEGRAIECELFNMGIDDTNKKVCIYSQDMLEPKFFNYSDIIDFEIYEDGKSVMKGRTGSAIAGGLLFGVAGAVIGASRSRNVNEICKTLQVRIYVNDLQKPEIIVNIINFDMDKNSHLYTACINQAKEIIAVLNYVMHNQTQQR